MASGRTFFEVVAVFRGLEATLDHVVTVTVDVHELRSGVPKRLEELGIAVVPKRLPVGDYIVGNGAVVERKSVLDLQDSLVKGRFWAQIGKLRTTATWPYLLIEGPGLAQGPVNAESLRGLWLAVTDLSITVLSSKDSTETALWLRRLAIRRQQPVSRDRPPYAQRFTRARPHPAEAALATAPGISVKTARLLLERFGSLIDVASAGRDEWQSVPGVGPNRAASLAAMVHERWIPDHTTSHSGVSRNGNPST
jgi:ERCC4-type nuclease